MKFYVTRSIAKAVLRVFNLMNFSSKLSLIHPYDPDPSPAPPDVHREELADKS